MKNIKLSQRSLRLKAEDAGGELPRPLQTSVTEPALTVGQVGNSLSYSYWFIPTLMTAIAAGLAFATLTLDRIVEFNSTGSLSLLYAGEAQSARMLLSTIAGTAISVAATTFSIVIVALTLTSSQFGPRLLRNFMRDTGNKVVLGTFAARFLYCLLILQTIQGGKQNVFLPKSQPLWASYWRSLASAC